jgi:hypothetical protein
VREGHLHQRPRSARAADCGAGPRKSCRYGQLAAPLPPPLAMHGGCAGAPARAGRVA